MGNPAQMQSQATPPAVVHGSMKSKPKMGTSRNPSLRTPAPISTSRLGLEVVSRKPSPKDCSTQQLFDIVMDVARRFRTAKEIVAEHRDYIMRLKAEVFKVKFGWCGVRVAMKCSSECGCPHTRRLLWKEFCEEEFGVSPDWIQYLCGGGKEKVKPEAGDNSGHKWNAILGELLDALEPCAGSLPLRAKDALQVAQELLERDTDAEDKRCEPDSVGRYWLTPRDVYTVLDKEFAFDFDPCPCPKPKGFDSLKMEWGKSSYVNPPFHKWNGGGKGPTAWVRKAIEEHQNGKQVVLLLPVQSYVNLLLEAGAEIRSAGRVRWEEADTKQPCTSPSPTACFILRPGRTRRH